MMKQWQWYESIRIKHLFALSCFFFGFFLVSFFQLLSFFCNSKKGPYW